MMRSVKVIVRGGHDTVRTTIANFIRLFLTEEGGFRNVHVVKDTQPLPPEKKDSFQHRLERNRDRPVEITVELEEG